MMISLVRCKGHDYLVDNSGSSFDDKQAFCCRMHAVGKKNNDELLISIGPHHCPSIASVPEGVGREQFAARRIILDGHSIPP